MFALHRPGRLESIVLDGSMMGRTRPKLPKYEKDASALGGLSRVQTEEHWSLLLIAQYPIFHVVYRL